MSDLEKQIEDAERALNNAVKKLGTVTGKVRRGQKMNMAKRTRHSLDLGLDLS